MSTAFSPAEVFPPGEYLRDELDERGWTVTEFAEIIGRPVQAVSEILNGKKEITTDTACALGDALGTTPNLWLNLQTNYRLHGARKVTDAPPGPVARRARLRALIPTAKARARGWLPQTDNLDVLEVAVQGLLEIDDLDNPPDFALAARRANSKEPISPEQTAWLAHVRLVARDQKAATFDRAMLEEVAAELPRRLKSVPADLVNVPRWFADCGVVVVFSEGLAGGKLDGAVTPLPDGRPVIGLTTRGDRFDTLLFTLLHECAHLTLRHITPDGVSIVDDDVTGAAPTDPREVEANNQASDWLFPGGFEFSSTSVPAIVETAARYSVHPSVVIGRIQWETGDWKRFRTRIPKVRAFLAAEGLLT